MTFLGPPVINFLPKDICRCVLLCQVQWTQALERYIIIVLVIVEVLALYAGKSPPPPPTTISFFLFPPPVMLLVFLPALPAKRALPPSRAFHSH